ncbi:MAG: leucine-rich repeat protein [Bacilli bacterium]|nr:leucine-rich repeat protein [Bacilli bacterium]
MFKPSYLGNNPYLFISYAHKDKELLSPFVNALQDKYHVWYDDGLMLGEEWTEDIIEHIKNCAIFIFFATNNSLKSDYCKKEINFASSKGVPFINIFIEDAKIPDWFEFSYSHVQRCECFMNNKEEFIAYLERKLPKELFDKLQETSVDIKEKESKTKKDAIKDNKEEFVMKGDVLTKYLGHQTIVNLPSNIIKIDDLAFKDNPYIKKVVINDNVKDIGFGAFSNCLSLEEVVLPTNLRKISGEVFSNCTSLKEIIFPSSLEEIDESAFLGCESLNKITLPEGLKVISPSLFENCLYLMDITIPDSVTQILPFAFKNCKNLQTIKLSKNLEDIGEGVFENCSSLTFIDLNNSVKSIQPNAFKNCSSLKKIDKTFNVYYIGEYAFTNCASLMSFVSNASIICAYAFDGCLSLRNIIISENLTHLSKNVFSTGNAISLLYEGSKKKWKQVRKDPSWNNNSRCVLFDNTYQYLGMENDDYFSENKIISEEEFYKTRYPNEIILNLFKVLFEEIKSLNLYEYDFSKKCLILYYPSKKMDDSKLGHITINSSFNSLKISFVMDKIKTRSSILEKCGDIPFCKYYVASIKNADGIKEVMRIIKSIKHK